MAKFIYVEHPEGGELAVNADHISSAHYKPSSGADIKTRLTIDLDNSETDVILLADEADRVWGLIKDLA
jgi:hypothetical protein